VDPDGTPPFDAPPPAGRHEPPRRAGLRLPAGVPLWSVITALVVVLVGVTTAVVVYASGDDSAPRAGGSDQTHAPGTGAQPAPTGLSSGGAPGADSCVSSTLTRLGLTGQVGQLLMVGTPVDNAAAASGSVQKYHLGGVFLTGRLKSSSSGLKQALAKLQTTARNGNGVGLHVGADQEGGQVQTLQGPDFPAIPTAVAQGQWDAATLKSRTTEWAGRVKGVGVTIDLAPVADVVPDSIGKANPPIGAFQREYGTTPTVVADAITTVVPAMQAAGVETTLKHFPGLGRVRANTDTSTNARDDTTSESDASLQPFAKGIAAGTTAVMISSAAYPRLDPNSIAAFSAPIVTGLLRQKLGFSGLVLSDDLGAAVAAANVPVGERAVRFVKAGGDMVLTVRPADAQPMSDALLATAKADRAFAARVQDAATHVLRSKAAAGLLTC
jgi:beta-N-acetylhexosaminidase